MKNNLTSYSLTEESLGEPQAHISVWCLMRFWSIDIRSFNSDKKHSRVYTVVISCRTARIP